ncbi:MAG: hypothetical protein QQW96_04235 [Tychonema bourrellyi B0820]|nr:hypothetical protein [Tychonema bourrellyi]MDQ2096838.1 hypothetical protein [Tychonema bourrellyi B0820]
MNFQEIKIDRPFSPRFKKPIAQNSSIMAIAPTSAHLPPPKIQLP